MQTTASVKELNKFGSQEKLSRASSNVTAYTQNDILRSPFIHINNLKVEKLQKKA